MTFNMILLWFVVISILDQLKVLYPDLITARQSIGQTVEGREIWAVKISSVA